MPEFTFDACMTVDAETEEQAADLMLDSDIALYLAKCGTLHGAKTETIQMDDRYFDQDVSISVSSRWAMFLARLFGKRIESWYGAARVVGYHWRGVLYIARCYETSGNSGEDDAR